MHPLLPFYAVGALFMLMGTHLRSNYQRSQVLLASWLMMSVVIFGVIFRTVKGDTWRYYNEYLRLRDMSLNELWAQNDGNWLFVQLNWVLGLFGQSHFWLIAPIALFCPLMLWYSMRHVLNPMPAAVALFLYSVYPFFIMYAASGMKQAIAMAFLLQAYVCLYQRRSIGWIWLFLAVGFHTGAALVFPIIILHLLTFRPQFGKLRALKLSIVILSFSIALSITNLNQIFMSSVQPYLVVSDNYQVYFLDATNFNYRAGFRLDFTIFSVIPILCALWLRKCGNGLSLNKSGWWLNLYILLASLYQIFAFAPYADRFASFGWHIMPFILLIMSSETGMRRVFQILLLIGVPINLALLQFYTLQNIHLDL